MEKPIKIGWFGGKTPLFSETSNFMEILKSFESKISMSYPLEV